MKTKVTFRKPTPYGRDTLRAWFYKESSFNFGLNTFFQVVHENTTLCVVDCNCCNNNGHDYLE